MSDMFRSLSNRNYRVWFTGAFISNIGVWMQGTAQNWVVLTELTKNDAFAVGITMALQFGPQLVLVPITGTIADRFDRRKAQLYTRVLSVLLALALGVLLLTGSAQLWHLYVFAGALGTINAFDTPARQAFVSDLVPRQLLQNAVALNSASFNSARLIGPAVAGVMIAAIGSGWVFLVNAACFVAVIVSLLMVPSIPRVHTSAIRTVTGAHKTPPKDGLMAGFRYVLSRPDLVVIITMIFLVGTFGLNFPIYASTMAVYFGHGAGEFGVLSSILAIGSLTGALLVARSRVARMRVVTASAFGFGLAALAGALMPNYVLFAVTLVFLGLFTSIMLSTANGFVQSTSEPRLRGRVLSIYFAILMGGTPLGAPLVGWIADRFGPHWAISVAAISGILASAVGLLWLIVSRQLRVHWISGEGMRVSHRGRPDPRQISPDTVIDEALTAPLSVLKREPEYLDAEYTASGSLTGDDTVSVATGMLDLKDITRDDTAARPDE